MNKIRYNQVDPGELQVLCSTTLEQQTPYAKIAHLQKRREQGWIFSPIFVAKVGTKKVIVVGRSVAAEDLIRGAQRTHVWEFESPHQALYSYLSEGEPLNATKLKGIKAYRAMKLLEMNSEGPLPEDDPVLSILKLEAEKLDPKTRDAEALEFSPDLICGEYYRRQPTNHGPPPRSVDQSVAFEKALKIGLEAFTTLSTLNLQNV